MLLCFWIIKHLHMTGHIVSFLYKYTPLIWVTEFDVNNLEDASFYQKAYFRFK